MRFSNFGSLGSLVDFGKLSADDGIVGGGGGSGNVEPSSGVSEGNAEGEIGQGEEVKKDNRGRKPADTIDYPYDKETKITSLPLDPPWNSKLHKMLKPAMFADEADYLEWRGQLYLERGKKMVDKANTLRSLGTLEERELASDLEKTVARMAKAKEQMQALREQLEAAGQDPDMVLKMLQGE